MDVARASSGAFFRHMHGGSAYSISRVNYFAWRDNRSELRAMDWTNGTPFALAALGLFLAGVIKGTTGLGYSSCALPFLVSAIGLKPAMALVLIPAMATNVSVA